MSAIAYTGIAMIPLVGLASLVIDGGLYMTRHTQLQHAVDAKALAAAGELDRQPDACDRAVLAMEEIDNADGELTVRFLTNLPANDAEPIPASMEAACSTARYIEVVMRSNYEPLFPVPGALISATAVAGYTGVALTMQDSNVRARIVEPDEYYGPLRAHQVQLYR